MIEISCRFDSKSTLTVHEKGHLKPRQIEKPKVQKVQRPQMDPSDPENSAKANRGFSSRGSVMEHEVLDGPQCFKCGAICKDKAHYKNHLLSHYYRYSLHFLSNFANIIIMII